MALTAVPDVSGEDLFGRRFCHNQGNRKQARLLARGSFGVV